MILGHPRKVKSSILVEVRPTPTQTPTHSPSLPLRPACVSLMSSVAAPCLPACLRVSLWLLVGQVIRLAKMDPEVDSSLDVREVIWNLSVVFWGARLICQLRKRPNLLDLQVGQLGRQTDPPRGPTASSLRPDLTHFHSWLLRGGLLARRWC